MTCEAPVINRAEGAVVKFKQFSCDLEGARSLDVLADGCDHWTIPAWILRDECHRHDLAVNAGHESEVIATLRSDERVPPCFQACMMKARMNDLRKTGFPEDSHPT
jgi:hypothetical protein